MLAMIDKNVVEFTVVQSLMEVATKKMDSAQKILENSHKEKQELGRKHKKMMDSYSTALSKFNKQQLNSSHTYATILRTRKSP